VVKEALNPFYQACSISKLVFKEVAKRSTEKVCAGIARQDLLFPDEAAVEAFLDANQRRRIAALVAGMVEHTLSSEEHGTFRRACRVAHQRLLAALGGLDNLLGLLRLCPSLHVVRETSRRLDTSRRGLARAVERLAKISPAEEAAATASLSREDAVDVPFVVHDSRDTVRELTGLGQEVLSGIAGCDRRVSEACLFNDADVVFCTLSAMGRRSLEGNVSFDTVVVDEAAQATEAETLIALKHADLAGCRLLLVGDPQQLPPTVLSRQADQCGLGRSCMERLLTSARGGSATGPHFQLLETQFRMHPSISRWPRHHFYKGELLDDDSVTNRPRLVTPWHDEGGRGEYAVVDVAHGAETRHGVSWRNPAEAESVGDIVTSMLSAEQGSTVQPEQIGVIAFYAAQVALIAQVLARRGIQGVAVRTVDSFQGAELDLCVLSCTRANPKGVAGFAQDARRLNVALTRARYGMVVVCDADSLSRAGGNLARLVKDARDRKCIGPAATAARQGQPAKNAALPVPLPRPKHPPPATPPPQHTRWDYPEEEAGTIQEVPDPEPPQEEEEDGEVDDLAAMLDGASLAAVAAAGGGAEGSSPPRSPAQRIKQDREQRSPAPKAAGSSGGPSWWNPVAKVMSYLSPGVGRRPLKEEDEDEDDDDDNSEEEAEGDSDEERRVREDRNRREMGALQEKMMAQQPRSPVQALEADLDRIVAFEEIEASRTPRLSPSAARGPRLPAEIGRAGLVDLNTASVADLQGIPKVGAKKAEAIVAARPFASIEAVAAVPGIGPAIMVELRRYGAL